MIKLSCCTWLPVHIFLFIYLFFGGGRVNVFTNVEEPQSCPKLTCSNRPSTIPSWRPRLRRFPAHLFAFSAFISKESLTDWARQLSPDGEKEIGTGTSSASVNDCWRWPVWPKDERHLFASVRYWRRRLRFPFLFVFALLFLKKAPPRSPDKVRRCAALPEGSWGGGGTFCESPSPCLSLLSCSSDTGEDSLLMY